MKQLILIASFFITTIVTTFAQTDLTVNITGINNTKGVIRIALFNNEAGFPSNDKIAFKLITAKIDGATVSVVIPKISFGKYAVVVFHDENNNNKLDTNFIGMPKEGTGTSNANEKAMGKPNYSNALFNLTEKTKSISIKIFY